MTGRVEDRRHIQRTRRARYAEKQEAVLNAAAALFRERGYAGSSLDELAERLSITKPTLYYYVESKEALLHRILVRVQDQVLDFMREAAERPDTAYGRLREIMIRYAVVLTSDFGACMAVPRRLLDAQSRQDVETRIDEADRILRRLLAEGVAEGSLKAVDPIIALHTLFGSLNWISHWYRAGGSISPGDLAQQQVDLLMTGVRGSAYAASSA